MTSFGHLRRRYDQTELEPCRISFYTIMTNNNGPLQALDRRTNCAGYDMVLE